MAVRPSTSLTLPACGTFFTLKKHQRVQPWARQAGGYNNENQLLHGIIFFYIQKFADEATSGKTTWLKLRETVTATNSRYLPKRGLP